MKVHCVYLTLLAMILCSCQLQQATQSTSNLPTYSNLNPQITRNFSPGPPTPTVSHIFTQIPEGIDTPVFPIKAPTYTPTSPIPTLSPQEIAGTILKDLNIDKEWKPSPNGMCVWERLLGYTNTEVASIKYNNQIFEYVTVSCGPEPKKLVIVDQWAEGGLGYSIPALLGWSVDENYLYFNDAVIPDGCQPLGGYQKDLRKVNLASGEIVSFPLNLVEGMTLSPLTDAVIYSDPQTIEVGIYDLNASMEKRIPIKLPEGLEYWEVGNFTWSPDSKMVVFIVQYGDPCFPVMYSLRQVDRASNQIITLLEKENQVISIVEWNATDRVLISIDKKDYWLNPMTGGVSIAPECSKYCVITQPE